MGWHSSPGDPWVLQDFRCLAWVLSGETGLWDSSLELLVLSYVGQKEQVPGAGTWGLLARVSANGEMV